MNNVREISIRRAWAIIGCLVVLIFLVTLGSIGKRSGDGPHSNQVSQVAPPPIMQVRTESTAPLPAVARSYGKLPLLFEENRGQTNEEVKYVSRGGGYSLFLTSSEAVLSLLRPARNQNPIGTTELEASKRFESAVVRFKYIQANTTPTITGERVQEGRANYLIGNDASSWRRDLRTYGLVRYSEIYPGIDLVYYGSQGLVEHDFIVKPGGDVQNIRLVVQGSQDLQLNPDGNLEIQTSCGNVFLKAPVTYQELGTDRISVESKYSLKKHDGVFTISFDVGQYDKTKSLIIDPIIAYSTYLGGSNSDNSGTSNAIIVDSTGSAYITGSTSSLNFPVANAIQSSSNGSSDIFITKLSPGGDVITYSTYLGGSGSDAAQGIARDTQGNIIIAGQTSSTNFPIVSGIQSANQGGTDCFVSKLSPNGSSLIFSTYLGGSGSELGGSVAVDSSGNIHFVGATNSNNLPVLNAFQTSLSGLTDNFVCKITSLGTLSYLTYLGGSNMEQGRPSIALDPNGNSYITGSTSSSDFPASNSFGGYQDAYLVKLNPNGSLSFANYLGGTELDDGYGIAVDAAGNSYVVGWTHSDDFPTLNAYQNTAATIFVNPNTYRNNGFVTKFNSSGSIVYSTYLGGGYDFCTGVALDTVGNAYISGIAASPNFPTVGSLQSFNLSGNPTYTGLYDAFLAKLSPSGSALLFSTFLGGSSSDIGNSIAFSGGDAYITGQTFSGDLPVINPAQSTYRGSGDVFVIKVGGVGDPLASPTNLATSVISTSRIDLQWSDNSSAESEFLIERRDGLTGSFVQIATTSANTTSYSNTGLAYGIDYFYRVRATDGVNNSTYTNEANSATILNVPTILLAESISTTAITVTWTDNSNLEAGYRVERKTGTGGIFQEVALLGANSIVFNDTGLSDGQEYSYRVRATDGTNNSDYSAIATATTSVLQGPSNLVAEALSLSEISLSWSDNTTYETSYQIERKQGAGGAFALLTTVNPSITTFNDSGLLEGTQYFYRVSATDGLNSSDYSNEASATTWATPVITAGPSANPNPVLGTTASLSVVANDPGGTESSLIYTWLRLTGPGDVSFSSNDSNSAKNTTVTFTKVGNYQLQVLVTDPTGLTTTGTVSIAVQQTASSAAVSPATVTVSANKSQQFTAHGKDQFGDLLATQPTFSWTVSGGGTINSSGVFTASNQVGGPFNVTATSGAISATASVTVVTWNFDVDTKPPSILSLSPESCTFTSDSDISFSGDFSDAGSGINPASIVIRLNGTNVTAQAITSAAGFVYNPPAALAEGSYVLTVSLADYAGNAISMSSTVDIDATPPPAPIITNITRSPNRVIVSGNVPPGVADTLVNATGVSFDSTTTGTFVVVFSKTANESFNFSLTFTDEAGNVGPPLNATESFVTETDFSPAPLVITSWDISVPAGSTKIDRDGKTYARTNSATVQFTIAGGVAPYDARVAGNPATPVGTSGEIFEYSLSTPDEGEYFIPIAVADDVGQFDERPLSLIVDRTGPTITLTTPLKYTTADLQCLILGPADKEVYFNPLSQDRLAVRNVFGASTFTPEADIEDISEPVQLSQEVRAYNGPDNPNLTFFRVNGELPPQNVVLSRPPDTLAGTTTLKHWVLPAPGALSNSLNDYASQRAIGMWATDATHQNIGQVINPDDGYRYETPDTGFFQQHIYHQLFFTATDSLGNTTTQRVLNFIVDRTPPKIRAIRYFSPVLTVNSDEDVYEMIQLDAVQGKLRKEHLKNPIYNSIWRLEKPVPFIGTSLVSENIQIYAEDIAGNTNIIGSQTITAERKSLLVADWWDYNIDGQNPGGSNANYVQPQFNDPSTFMFHYSGNYEDEGRPRWTAGDNLLLRNFDYNSIEPDKTGRTLVEVSADWQRKSFGTRIDYFNWPDTKGVKTSLFYDEPTGEDVQDVSFTAENGFFPVTVPWNATGFPSAGPIAALKREIFTTPVRWLLPREDEMCTADGIVPGRTYDLQIPRADGVPSKKVFDDSGLTQLTVGLNNFILFSMTGVPPNFQLISGLNSETTPLGPLFLWYEIDPYTVLNDPVLTSGLPAAFTGAEEVINVRLAGIPRYLPAGLSPFAYMCGGPFATDYIGEAAWPRDPHSKINLLRTNPSTLAIGQCQSFTIEGAELANPGDTSSTIVFKNSATGVNVTAAAGTSHKDGLDKIIVERIIGAYYNQTHETDTGALGLAGGIAQMLNLEVYIGPDVPAGIYDIYLTTPNGLTNQKLPGALKLIKCHLTADANHDGQISGLDYVYDSTPHGILMTSGFGRPNHPQFSERIKVKLDVGNEGYVILYNDNPRVRIYDQAQNGTEIQVPKVWELPGQVPPAAIYLEFEADEIVNLALETFRMCGTAQICYAIDETRIVRHGNGLGADDGISARSDVLPGYASINLMRGNLYFGATARTYTTPAEGPDVTVSYNHLDGITTGIGHSWRTNYDVRVFDSSSDKNCDGIVAMNEREDGDLLVLIDETGRRYIFEFDTASQKFKSDPKCGLLEATINPDPTGFDPTGTMGFQYKLIRNDNHFFYFRGDGELVCIEDIRGKKLTIERTDLGDAISVTDEYGRSEPLFGNSFGFAAENLIVLTGRELPTFQFAYDTADPAQHPRIELITVFGNFTHGSNAATYEVYYNASSKVQFATLPPVPSGFFYSDIEYTPDTKDGSNNAVVYEPFGGQTAVNINADADAWTSSTNAVGTTTTRSIDAAIRRISTSITGRYHATMSYDIFGNMTAMAVAGGTTQSWSYSEFGMEGANLLETQGVSGSGTSVYDYFTAGLKKGRVKTFTDGCNNTTEYQYDADGFLSQTTDAREMQWTVGQVNGVGQVLSTTSPEGRTTTSTYTRLGRVNSQTDSMSYTTTYGYDSRSRLVRVTQPGGAFSQTVFDPLDRTAATLDLNGNVTYLTYDAIGRQVQEAPDGIAPLDLTYSPLPLGGMQVVSSRAGRTLSTAILDKIGRTRFTLKPEVTELGQPPENARTDYFYSSGEGWLERINDPRGNDWSYTYDDAGRVVFTTTPLGHTSETVYDPAGRVESRIDADDHSTEYEYDDNDRITRVTNPAGGFVSTAYDPTGNVLSVTPSSGNPETFTYDDDGVNKTRTDKFGKVQHITVNDAARKITTSVENIAARTTTQFLGNKSFVERTQTPFGSVFFGHRPDGVMTEATPPGRGTYGMTLDSLDRVTSSFSPSGSTAAQYSATHGDLIGQTSVLGLQTTNQIDAATGSLTSSYDSVGLATNPNVIVQLRDENGNITQYLDAQGRVWQQNFDDDNRRITQDAPDGITTRWEYSPGGMINEVTKTDGSFNETTTIEYNNLNQPSRITDPSGRAREWAYDNLGLVQTETVGSLTTSYAYNPGTRLLTSKTEPGSVVTQYVRDSFGRVTQIVAPGNAITRYTYNDLDQVTEIIHPDEVKESFEYLSNGDLKEHTDRSGRCIQFSYDNAGRVIQKSFHDTGDSVSYSYNSAGMVLSETGFGGNVSHSYDSRGRRTSATHNGQGASFTYRNDNSIDTKSYAGETLTHNYNSLGRIESISGTDGTIGFTYDSHGRVQTMQLPGNLSRSYTYDAAGRTVSMVQNLNGQNETHEYVYDSVGRLKRHRAGNAVTTYAYDAAGRLAAEATTGAQIQNYGYNPSGNRTAQGLASLQTVVRDFSGTTLPEEATSLVGVWSVSSGKLNGSGTDYALLGVTPAADAGMQYSVKVRPATASLGAEGPDVAAGIVFGGTAQGRYLASLVAFKITEGGQPTLKRKLRLDWIDQASNAATLVAETGAQNYSGAELTLTLEFISGEVFASVFEDGQSPDTLDTKPANGITGTIGLEIRGTGAIASEFDDLGWQVATPVSTNNHAYNAMNQLIHSSGTEDVDYHYDSAGRLTEVLRGGISTKYTYDRLDRMIGVDIGGQQSSYTYYGPSWMRKTATVSGTTTSYTYDGFACVAQTTGGVTTRYGTPGGSPLWQKTTGQSANIYAQDGRGNVTGLWNGTGFTEKYSYDAFGKVKTTNGSGTAVANTSGPRYRGQLYDSHSDQVYLRHRYYESSAGRFNSMDPKGMVDGANLYSYGGNDPVNRHDPMGTKWWQRGPGERVWHDDGDGPIPTMPPFSPAEVSQQQGRISWYDKMFATGEADVYNEMIYANLRWDRDYGKSGFAARMDRAMSSAVNNAGADTLVGIADAASLGAFSTYGKADLVWDGVNSGRMTVTEGEKILWENAKERVLETSFASLGSMLSGHGPTGRGPLSVPEPSAVKIVDFGQVRSISKPQAQRLAPNYVGGTQGAIEKGFVPGPRFNEPRMNLSPSLKLTPELRDVQMTKAALVQQGQLKVKGTVSRLDIGGRRFYGTSEGMPKAIISEVQEAGHPMTAPTQQFLRHAEGDSLSQAFRQKVVAEEATMWVTQKPCDWCDSMSGIQNMLRLMEVKRLRVYYIGGQPQGILYPASPPKFRSQ